jgi:hypothetical protein
MPAFRIVPVFSVDSYGENAGRLLGVAMAKGGGEKGKWTLRYWQAVFPCFQC